LRIGRAAELAQQAFPMNERYAHSYAVLGLRSGSSWVEIRKAYKNAINQWHPDRFQQDGEKKRIAEEQSMEITRAYKILADYYRRHGSAPDLSAPPSIDVPVKPNEAQAPSEITEPVTFSRYGRAHQSSTPAESSLSKGVVTTVLISLFLYFWFLNDPVEHPHQTGTLPPSSARNVSQPDAVEKTVLHPADKYFTRGSKLGEVYAIQGVPSKTEDGIWYYGKSRVYFANGSVSHWDSHPDSPLNASLEIDPPAVTKNFIQRGSTKAEVIALQGAPWLQTEREWTYGASRIFFYDNVVTEWKESPQNPLKIKREH